MSIQQKESGRKISDKWALMHRQVEEQPSKKPKTGGDKSAVAIMKKCATVGLRITGSHNL